jgi:nitrite reductase/ring-hydroxylating ferredoxin subunit
MTDTVFTPRKQSASSPQPDGARLPDAWWPIAFGDQIGKHPKQFRLGRQRFAVYRDLRGVVRGVDDVCPHRRLPLSMGRITEDGYLQCAYHGWCYDGETGQCTAIPNLSPGERVPRGIRVRAFSTVESIADALGWGLRTPVLAPRVGPPTGAEPDEGTTMLPAAVVGRFVFVWTGSGRPSDPQHPPSFAKSTATQRPIMFGEITVRAPHTEVCEALLWNPGKLLGLSWLIGGGDEVVGPAVSASSSVLSVRRRRVALDLPRASTFGPIAKRTTTSLTTMDAVTGLTSIDVSAYASAPAAHMVVALTPVGGYRTVLRWAATFDHNGYRARRSAGAWLARTARLRATTRAEALVDAAEDAIDAALDALRSIRLADTAKDTADTGGQL